MGKSVKKDGSASAGQEGLPIRGARQALECAQAVMLENRLTVSAIQAHTPPSPKHLSLRIDTADSQPCIGTGGIVAWQLTAFGKLFHSGLPNKSGGWAEEGDVIRKSLGVCHF